MNEDLTRSVEAELGRLSEMYAQRGYAGRVGFGERPALLVIDLVRAFTDPASDLSGELDREVDAAGQLVQAAHEADTLVIFSTVAYEPGLEDSGIWRHKVPGSKWLIGGTSWTEVDPRLGKRPEDMLLVKKYASCFAGTDLVSRLVSNGVDTLLIAGATTSGCVRASAVDACSLGFRTIVVRDAVGDRALLPHLANLFDIDMKYGDVVSLDAALDYLATVGEARATGGPESPESPR